MSGLSSILHTIGENLPFRTEQESRDFHADVDALGNSDDVADAEDTNPADDNGDQGDKAAAKSPVVGAKPAPGKR